MFDDDRAVLTQLDDEMKALRSIVVELEQIPRGAHERMLQYLWSRYVTQSKADDAKK